MHLFSAAGVKTLNLPHLSLVSVCISCSFALSFLALFFLHVLLSLLFFLAFAFLYLALSVYMCSICSVRSHAVLCEASNQHQQQNRAEPVLSCSKATQ